MELEFINQLTGTGANGVVMLVGYILWKHDLRLQKLEGENDRSTT